MPQPQHRRPQRIGLPPRVVQQEAQMRQGIDRAEGGRPAEPQAARDIAERQFLTLGGEGIQHREAAEQAGDQIAVFIGVRFVHETPCIR